MGPTPHLWVCSTSMGPLLIYGSHPSSVGLPHIYGSQPTSMGLPHIYGSQCVPMGLPHIHGSQRVPMGLPHIYGSQRVPMGPTSMGPPHTYGSQRVPMGPNMSLWAPHLWVRPTLMGPTHRKSLWNRFYFPLKFTQNWGKKPHKKTPQNTPKCRNGPKSATPTTMWGSAPQVGV